MGRSYVRIEPWAISSGNWWLLMISYHFVRVSRHLCPSLNLRQGTAAPNRSKRSRVDSNQRLDMTASFKLRCFKVGRFSFIFTIIQDILLDGWYNPNQRGFACWIVGKTINTHFQNSGDWLRRTFKTSQKYKPSLVTFKHQALVDLVDLFNFKQKLMVYFDLFPKKHSWHFPIKITSLVKQRNDMFLSLTPHELLAVTTGDG